MKRYCTLKNKAVGYADCIACTESGRTEPCQHIECEDDFVFWEQ